eukprot:2769362-Pyramimonas_sp.AAC.2
MDRQTSLSHLITLERIRFSRHFFTDATSLCRAVLCTVAIVGTGTKRKHPATRQTRSGTLVPVAIGSRS